MKLLGQVTLADPTLERVRQEQLAAINEIRSSPALGMRVIADVSLADGIDTPVAHGLGRPARWARESAPRGPVTTGLVEEVRGGSFDRSRYVVLRASGWGATITVDVLVM